MVVVYFIQQQILRTVIHTIYMFIMCKIKKALLKTLIFPRLELCGTVLLLAKVIGKVTESLDVTFNKHPY